MEEYKRVYAAIDLDAVKSNMEAMEKALPQKAGIIGVVKTDGYGHGAVPVAQAIREQVKGYAVATPEEGLILRRHSITKPILVLGPVPECSYPEMIRHQLRPPMFERESVERFHQAALELGVRAPIHLAVDTGMSRIGMKPDEASADMVKGFAALPAIELEGIFTHFATADERDKRKTLVQLKKYLDFDAMLIARGVDIPQKHCANSAGILESLGTGCNLVRAGISIYGMYPSDQVGRDSVKLRPAMELKAFITYVKTIEPGTEVSYGGAFTAERKMRIATIPVGYGDGYPRNLSQKGWVLIRGRRAPILGRVCMDQFMVDVTEITGVQAGDLATLMGKDGSEEILAEDLARLSGGFHYEIVCGIGKRVPRVYLSGGRIVGKKDYFQDTYEELP